MTTTLAVIGGSGLYDLPGLAGLREHRVLTPFGAPSDAIVEGTLHGVRLLFLARHGKGHRLLPSEVPYRANIFALKQLGAERCLSISAVGSLREEIKPGEFVVADQFIDRTKGRPSTFFGSGIAGHVMFADPVCPELSSLVAEAVRGVGIAVHQGGTLMVMEGPAFSTRAESHMHRQFGAQMIGMTAMPEAKLAREAELCYATLAMATDYDCWHETEDDVSVDAVVRILTQNAANGRAAVERLAQALKGERSCGCGKSLDHAIITAKHAIAAEQADRMRPVFGRVL